MNEENSSIGSLEWRVYDVIVADTGYKWHDIFGIGLVEFAELRLALESEMEEKR